MVSIYNVKPVCSFRIRPDWHFFRTVRVGINPLRENWLNAGDSFHSFDTMGHNWWSVCVYMAGVASLAIQNEVPEAKQRAVDISGTITEWIGYTGSVLQNKPRNFDRNGGFYESINYVSSGVSQYLLFRLAMNNVMPEVEQPNVDELEKMSDFFINTTYYRSEDRPFVVNFEMVVPHVQEMHVSNYCGTWVVRKMPMHGS